MRISILFITVITGIFRSFSLPNHSISDDKSGISVRDLLPQISMATSALSTASRVCCIRFSPKILWSSNPGVSTISDAPIFGNSIALYIISVVVPSTSDTTDVCCPVMAFNNDDLPLLVAPNITMCRRSELGVLVVFILFLRFYIKI